ncbi:MAG: type III-A CRISPR-associated protein Csm2 [Halarcobacter sp.]
MQNIVLDYTKNEELFNKVAQEWALAIGKTKKTQLRNFYEYIMDLENKLNKNNEDVENIIPFVKMLNSKVSYARSRGVVSKEFQDMMSQCVSLITKENIKDTLLCFKLFFEAVLGFFEGRD